MSQATRFCKAVKLMSRHIPISRYLMDSILAFGNSIFCLSPMAILQQPLQALNPSSMQSAAGSPTLYLAFLISSTNIFQGEIYDSAETSHHWRRYIHHHPSSCHKRHPRPEGSGKTGWPYYGCQRIGG